MTGNLEGLDERTKASELHGDRLADNDYDGEDHIDFLVPTAVSAFEVGDLVVFENRLGDETLGRIVEISGSGEVLKVQHRGAKDVDNPVSVTGPIEDHSGVNLVHLLKNVVLTESDKVKTFFGAGGLTFRGKPYFPGMRHTEIGNFARGNIVRIPEIVNVDQDSGGHISSNSYRTRALAGFMICSTRPNLKVIVCDLAQSIDQESTEFSELAIEIIGISKGKWKYAQWHVTSQHRKAKAPAFIYRV